MKRAAVCLLLILLLLSAGCAGVSSGSGPKPPDPPDDGGGGITNPPPSDTVFTPAGVDPGGMAFDAGTGRLVFAVSHQDRVFLIDTAALQVVKSVEARGGPIRAGFDAVTQMYWVAMMDSGRVARFDRDLEPVDELSIGGMPRGIAIDSSRRRAYVVDFDRNQLIVIDLDSSNVLERIRTDYGPRFAAVDPASGRVLVGCTTGGSLLLFEPDGTIIDRLSGFVAPTSGTAFPAAEGFLITDYGWGEVFLISAVDCSIVERRETAYGAAGVALVPGGAACLVGNGIDTMLSLVEIPFTGPMSSLRAEVAAQGFVALPGTDHCLAADYRTGSLNVMRTTNFDWIANLISGRNR
ncbi:MAG: YncE family protein [Fimbriimonadaceae bacterium]